MRDMQTSTTHSRNVTDKSARVQVQTVAAEQICPIELRQLASYNRSSARVFQYVKMTLNRCDINI